MNRRWTFVLVAAIVVAFLIALTPVASAAPPSAPPASSSIIHVVRPGETLSGIARYYGVDMWALARANNIFNPNHIYVGQRLVIYTPGTTGFIHVVQPGETLLRIAAYYGVNAWTIAQANGLYNLNYIWVGQRLLIPGYSQPYVPPSGGAWYGEYYNNLTLTGQPCGTRQDSGINFNWGWGAPMPGVDADAFSVRWTRSFTFSGGTYRFYARVDDGVRVWVDNVLIIDRWYDGAVRTFSADMALSAGAHNLRVEYYDKIQVARIHFWWERVGNGTVTPTVTPTSTASPTAPAGVWHGVWYNNAYLLEPPAAEATTPWIGFEWVAGGPDIPGIGADFFSVRWSQTAYFDTADTYRFCMMIDDGGRIWVDGDLVVDEWHLTNGLHFCGEKALTAGNHEIVVEYFEWSGEALVYFWWE